MNIPDSGPGRKQQQPIEKPKGALLIIQPGNRFHSRGADHDLTYLREIRVASHPEILGKGHFVKCKAEMLCTIAIIKEQVTEFIYAVEWLKEFLYLLIHAQPG